MTDAAEFCGEAAVACGFVRSILGEDGTMKKIEWLNDNEFRIDDVKFIHSVSDYSLRTNSERIIVLKNRQVLDDYYRVCAADLPRNILEFGIFQGGSPALFSLWFELDKFVGIDLCEPVKEFDNFCARHPVGQKIRSYYGVSQADKERVEQIIRDEYSHTPIDLIIDDASHLYEFTRRSFEIAFPHLRPGGIYVVEDWGWAHWPGSKFFIGKTSMSIFIMELIMLCASRSDLISEVRVFPSFAFIKKAEHAPAMTEMNLSELYNKRGLDIFGAEGPSMSELAKFFSERVSRRLRKRKK